MAIGTDRVQVLKQESAALGGNAADDVPYTTAIEPEEDALEACGVFFQEAGQRDETVWIERDANLLRFRDSVVTTPKALGAIVDHAAEHSQAGAQELLLQDLGSGALAAGKILQSDGTGGWNTVDNVPGTAAELNFASSEGTDTTTSSTFLQKLRLSVTSLPAGDYILFYSYVTTGSNNNTGIESRVQQNDTTDIQLVTNRAGAAGAQYANAGFKVLASLSGSHNFDIDWRRESGSGDAGILWARLTLWLIDN